MLSPFHRLVASLYGVRPSDLTEEQFGKVKRFAIVGLAGTFAVLSMLVSLVVHLQPRAERSSKLSRMIRAWLARKRRPIYRDVPGPTEYRDRIVVRWVPFDVDRGVKAKPAASSDGVRSGSWGRSTILHDTSAVDELDAAFAAKRAAEAYATRATAKAVVIKRAGVAALLGGAGLGLALFGASYLLELPRINYREIEVPQVTLKDTEVPRVILKDAVVPNIVLKDIPIEIPRIVITRTPQERDFVDSPAFANAPAEYRGRIISPRSPGVLSFAEGGDYVPTQPGMVADAAPYIGDFGACSPIPGTEHFHCVALHNGVVTSVPQKPAGRPT